MDIKALYPSILGEMAAKSAKNAIKKAKLTWLNIDTETLIRYVGMRYDREEIIKEKLDEVVPLPKGTTTMKSLANPRGKRPREQMEHPSFTL